MSCGTSDTPEDYLTECTDNKVNGGQLLIGTPKRDWTEGYSTMRWGCYLSLRYMEEFIT